MRESEEWVSVAEAARRLGITPRAVRKRCAMGNHRFRKMGNRLEMQWEPSGNFEEPEQEPLGTDGEPGGTAGEPPLTRLERQQQEEIAFLRAELAAQREAHSAEIARRDEEIVRRSQAEADLRQIVSTAQQAALVANRQIEALRQEIGEAGSRSAIAAAPQETVDAGQDGRSFEPDAKPSRAWWFFRKRRGDV